MATPRRRYAVIPFGLLEDVLAAGVSERAGFLLARVLTHRARRSVPGLLPLGPAGLAESLHQSQTYVKRAQTELERAGFLLVDEKNRLVYVRGAIENDPPRAENTLRGWGAQLRDLPPMSPVTLAVRAAIELALSSKETRSLLRFWRDQFTDQGHDQGQDQGHDQGQDQGHGQGLHHGPEHGPDQGPRARDPIPIPIPIPRSDPEIRSRSQQQPATSKAVPHAPDRRTSSN